MYSYSREFKKDHFQQIDYKKLGLQTVGISSAILILLYAITRITPPENDCIKEKYPFVYMWYNFLSNKYSHINFKDKYFLEHTIKTPNSLKLQWIGRHNFIQCKQETLEFLNYCYKEKIEGRTLSEYEISFLAEQEFELLEKVGYIDNYGTLKNYISAFCVVSFLEALKVTFQIFDSFRFIKNIYSRKTLIFNNFWDSLKYDELYYDYIASYLEDRDKELRITEIVLFGLLQIGYMAYQEIQSYKFAIQHADIAILQEMIKIGKIDTKLIHAEIEHRLQKINNIKCVDNKSLENYV